MRGRPPKHFHFLLEKEKVSTAAVKIILPKDISDYVVQKGSRFAHLYGHKKQLAVRPILSAAGTDTYKLAKWLHEKLKPLSVKKHTVSDSFGFVDDLQNSQVDYHSILFRTMSLRFLLMYPLMRQLKFWLKKHLMMTGLTKNIISKSQKQI